MKKTLLKQQIIAAIKYLHDNKHNIAVVIYAIMKNNKKPKKLNLDPEAQNGLIEIFLKKMQSSISDDDELEILDLSSSDERSKAIYHYDLDVPEELKVMDDVSKSDRHTMFDFTKDCVDDIRVLLVEIGDSVQQIVLYKTLAPINVFTRSHFFLKKHKTKFDKIDDDFIRISDSFQLLKTNDSLFVIELETLERSFGFHEVIKKEAIAGIAEINKKGIIGNIDTLTELVSDIRYARKLTKVSRASPVLNKNINNEKIIKFCQTFPTLINKFRFSEDQSQIILDTKVSKDLFIKILMDDFLQSQLTDFYYESIAKDEVNVSQ